MMEVSKAIAFALLETVLGRLVLAFGFNDRNGDRLFVSDSRGRRST